MKDSWAQTVADAVAAGAAAGLKDDAQRVVKDAYAKVKDLLTGGGSSAVGESDVREVEQRPSSARRRRKLAKKLVGAEGLSNDAELRGAISELVTVLREHQPDALAMANVTLERLVARGVVIKAGEQAASDPPPQNGTGSSIVLVGNTIRDLIIEHLQIYLSGSVGGPVAGSGLVSVGRIPKEPNFFVPREQVTELAEKVKGSQRTAVLCGMRGVGKTHVAAAYAREVVELMKEQDAGLVAWVNAENYDALCSELAEVAERLGVADPSDYPVEAAKQLRDHLNGRAEAALLVLDNATDADAITEFLPATGGTRVVITSTDHDFTNIGGAVVDVGGYLRAQSLDYLAAATTLSDPGGANEVAEELGDLPVALALAAATISDLGTDYRCYLQLLRSQPLPEMLQRHSGQDCPRPVDQAIMLSIETAERGEQGEGQGGGDPVVVKDPVVVWLLRVFAVLAPSGIPRVLLIHPRFRDHTISFAVARCVRHSLLTWSADKRTLVMHRLVGRVLRERGRDDGVLNVIEATTVLTTATPSDEDDRLTWPRWWAVLPHVEALAEHTDPTTATVSTVSLLSRFVAFLLYPQGLRHRAVPLAQRVVADCEQVHGGDHPDTLTSRHHLADAYESVGRVDEAITLYEGVVADRERILGVGHRDILTSRNNLAHAYMLVGRVGDAITLLEGALADRERVDRADTLTSRGNLAHVYMSVGRRDEAITVLEGVVADRERVHGGDHPDTLASRNNLAYAYMSVGRVFEAVNLHEQVVADSERVLGGDHPDTLTCRSNLAIAYGLGLRLDEAVPLHEWVLADRERVLGGDHPDTLESRDHLADARRRLRPL